MAVDDDGIRDLDGLVEVISNGFRDESLDLVCWDPVDGAGLFGSALKERR